MIVRYGWGRTYGYLMLRSTGFPRRIGHRFRLDTLIAWEQAVLAGPLRGGDAEGPGSYGPALTADPQTSEGPWRIRVPAPRWICGHRAGPRLWRPSA
jgi:hypothetical protein